MRKTTNYGFNKPEVTDFYNVDDFNENMDAIDEELKKVADSSANSEVIIGEHLSTNNPHGITKTDVGLSNVPNVSTNNQTPTYTVPDAASELSSGEKLSVAFGKIAKFIKDGIAKFTSIDNEIDALNGSLDNTNTLLKKVHDSTSPFRFVGHSNRVGTIDDMSAMLESYIESLIESKGNSNWNFVGQVGASGQYTIIGEWYSGGTAKTMLFDNDRAYLYRKGTSGEWTSKTIALKSDLEKVATTKGLPITGGGNFSTLKVFVTRTGRFIDIYGYASNESTVSSGATMFSFVESGKVYTPIFGNNNIIPCQCDDGSNAHFIGVKQDESAGGLVVFLGGGSLSANQYIRFNGRILLDESVL